MRLTVGQATDVRLGRQRAPQYETGANVVPYLRSANISDGILDLRDVKSMNFSLAEQRIFTLAAGDVLMTEGSGSRETVGTSAVWRDELPAPVCFQNTLLRLRPREGVTDGRFVAWWARHAHLSGQIAAVSSGANILHIGSDGLKRLQIDVPSLDEQRRIADFLDDRVARIDQAIDGRERQLSAADTLRDSQWAALTERLLRHGPLVPLRRVLRSIVDGPFGSSLTSQHYTDTGTRVVRLGNIGIAEWRDNDKAFIDQSYAEQLSGHAVEPGDLVMAGLGDDRWPLGRCAVMPAGLGPAIVKADCYRIRLNEQVGHDFAAIAISSPDIRKQIRLLARGATRARLNTEIAREVPMPVVGRPHQEVYVREFQVISASVSAAACCRHG